MVIETEILEPVRQSASHIIPEVTNPMVDLIGSVTKEAFVLPDKSALGSLRDGRLRVVNPIEVVQMSEGGGVVVEAPELNEFGFGDGFSEAIADLQATIAELYFTLETEQKRLGPELARVWSILSRKVRMADAVSRA
jgi:hypothetical protein